MIRVIERISRCSIGTPSLNALWMFIENHPPKREMRGAHRHKGGTMKRRTENSPTMNSRSLSPARMFRGLSIPALLLASGATMAADAVPDTFQFFVMDRYLYDDNLFRVADGRSIDPEVNTRESEDD